MRDRARTLGALLRGVSIEVYRASVVSASAVSPGASSPSRGRTPEYEYDDVAVSAEDWDRQARALRNRDSAGVGVNGAFDERGDADEEDAGGVTLRVEQVRLVLFEGKAPKGFSALDGTGTCISSFELHELV